MSDKYAHYRANVPRRRTTYKALIIAIFVVFLISLADIIWWDEVLQWGVYAAIAILFVWAIVMLFARVISDKHNMDEVVLTCPNCDNAFLYGADHADNVGHARMTCPICQFVGDLPVSEDQATEIQMPSGNRHDHTYACSNCEEHIVITTLGNVGSDVQFDVCPHCGEKDTVHAKRDVEIGKRRRIDFWNAA